MNRNGWFGRRFGMLFLFLLTGLPGFWITPLQAGETVVAAPEDHGTVKAGTETEAERNKVYMKIGEVTVSAQSDYLEAMDIPGSADVIGADQIETQNVDFSMELLRKVPGAYYGDWNQGVVSGTISMRGYDANHDVPVTLIVDGIPHNFGYGRMDIQPFFPLEIERMEVVKGTSDPRYGLSNIAGNVNVITKNNGNRTQARLLTGSFGTYDGSILSSQEEGRFSQTYFAGFRKTDGYRDHSDLQKGAVSGKWFYTSEDESLHCGVIARFFGMNANAPGYLTEEVAEDHPESAASFAASDGGKQENKHVSAHVDYRFSNTMNWSFRTYTQELERTRWCKWSDDGDQSERYSDDTQYGAVSTLTYEVENMGIDRLKLDWGLDFQYQDNVEQRWVTDNRVREGGPTRDWDFNQSYIGSYIRADGDINRFLRLVGALRVDYFSGDFENILTDTESDMLDLDFIWQPKVGAVITPVNGYSLYANYGKTFQLPSSPQLFGQDSSGNKISRSLSESTNDGWEAGVKVSPFSWLSARVDYWQIISSDEVRSKGDDSGDYINTGETQRKGWDMALTIRPHEWVAAWGSYSMVESEYTDPGEDLADRKGNEIENIPEYTAKLGADFDHPSGLSASIWLESQGEYYVDALNEKDKVGDYNIWNISLGYKTGIATIGFEVKNLFDETYNAFVWDSDDGFSPGDERSYYAWVMVEY